MTAVPPWLAAALGEIGVSEIAGPESATRVIAYHAATTLKATDDAVPWCSAFVNWCMKQAGIAGSGSAAARSWLQWGERIDRPRLGGVAVLSRGTNPAQGHVGLVLDEHGGALYLLGGNQGDRVGVQPFPSIRVLGYRWPTLAP